MTDDNNATPSAPVGRMKRTWRAFRRWPRGAQVTTWVLLGVLIIIAAASGGEEDAKPPKASETTAANTEPERTTSTSNATTSTRPQPTTTTAPPPSTTTVPPTTTSIPAPIVTTGSGDRIIDVTKPDGDPASAAIVYATHSGSSNFVIQALDADLQMNDLLVNTIGAYDGSVALDFDGSASTKLQIEADGPWTVEIRHLRSAPQWTDHYAGRGDQVVLFTGPTGVANITHNGESNFVVHYYGTEDSELLVNEIGNYTGQQPLHEGPAAIVVLADGDWRIDLE